MTVSESVDTIFSLYENYGSADYIGEPVSQLEHALQAAMMAEKEGFDTPVILAALFHDIGHLVALSKGNEKSMNGFGAVSHEDIGEAFLKELKFPERITSLVKAHVVAKRYLVSKDDAYFNQLSEASLQTLKFQGGKMSDEEMKSFEQHPDSELFIQMRIWDDKAKLKDFPTKNLNHYKQLCLDYLIESE
jgi:phosphonate degradation associated HDIG domain protein